MEKETINEQLAQALGLGSTPVDWPYSEKALLELIRLQQEREITKQQYFRLENIQKTTELFQKAIAVNVPPALIPTLLSGDAPGDDLLTRLLSTTHHNAPGAPMNPPTPQRTQGHSRSSQPQTQPQPQSQTQLQPQHQQHQMVPQQQAHQMQSPQRVYSYPPQAHTQYGNLGPPVSFQSSQRPHSPAKIGAAAVAQLERGRFSSSPVHKRTMSTPMTSYQYTPSAQHHTGHAHPPPPIHIQSPHQPQQMAQGQGSMMGTMSSLQFINENPGKKRRRSNSKDDDEGDATEDEAASGEPEKKEERKIRHTRTRSDHFIFEAPRTNACSETEVRSEASLRSETTGSREGSKVGPLVKKFEEGGTTPKGPKFANNILSSA